MTPSVRRFAALALLLAGCNAEPSRQLPAKVIRAPKVAKHAPAPPVAAQPAPAATGRSHDELPREVRSTLADLAATARATEFELPAVNAERVAAAGIRRLEGEHIILYTDLPAAADVDQLPIVFDAAVPLWSAYFGVEPARLAGWKLIGSVMKDKERFLSAGLYPESLPGFPHGYSVGSQIWLFDQPSDYFRRHLLLHEGTHAFMLRWLGGAGPPWYMEGMAELLGTHRWQDGKLTLGVMPLSKGEAPYWGRVKIVKDELAAGRGLSLIEVMRYDAHAHLRVEAYGWCWAAAAFLDAHPLTQAAFRGLKSDVRDRSLEFSKRFYEQVKSDWAAIVEDWQIFVADCDYGYDFARAAVIRKPAIDLNPAGTKVTVMTDRGWQSTGLRLEAGKTYRIEASGRYQLATGPQSWPCEAGGVTIRYSAGKPLGMLVGGLSDLAGEPASFTPLAKPQPIGGAAELTPQTTGTLYLKINEPASSLADNVGTLSISIRKVPGP